MRLNYQRAPYDAPSMLELSLSAASFLAASDVTPEDDPVVIDDVDEF